MTAVTTFHGWEIWRDTNGWYHWQHGTGRFKTIRAAMDDIAEKGLDGPGPGLLFKLSSNPAQFGD